MRATVQNAPLKHHHLIHCSIDSGIKSYQPPAPVVEARLHGGSSGRHHGAAADLPTTVDGFRKRYSSSEYDDDAPERRLLGRCGLPVLCCTLSLLLVAILACTSAATTVAWARHRLNNHLGQTLNASRQQQQQPGFDLGAGASAAAAAGSAQQAQQRPAFEVVRESPAAAAQSSKAAVFYKSAKERLKPLFDVIESIRPLAPWKRAVHAANRTKGIASYMGLCAIVKDQREDLLEWIEWHRWAAGWWCSWRAACTPGSSELGQPPPPHHHHHHHLTALPVPQMPGRAAVLHLRRQQQPAADGRAVALHRRRRRGVQLLQGLAAPGQPHEPSRLCAQQAVLGVRRLRRQVPPGTQLWHAWRYASASASLASDCTTAIHSCCPMHEAVVCCGLGADQFPFLHLLQEQGEACVAGIH